jgi:hypothetical protein
VRKDDLRRSFWQRKAKEDPSCRQSEFLSWLDKIPDGKSLLLPKKGGEFFVSLGKDSALYHADLNAAYRIALRALSHRNRAELLGQTWIEKEKKYYLVDTANVFPDSVLRDGCPFKTISSNERLWEKVNGDLAMQRCREINLARFADWKIALPQQIISKGLPPDEEDDIPM